MKILTTKQTHAAARALRKQGGLPAMSRCKILTKFSGKKLPFGELPRGVSVEVCREIVNGKDVVTARSTGPLSARTRKRRAAGLLGARKRKTLSGRGITNLRGARKRRRK